MKTTVSERGQVTIPKELRRRMGINPGQVLEFREEAGHLVAYKVFEQDPVSRVYGILGNDGRSTDDIIEEMRGPVDTV